MDNQVYSVSVWTHLPWVILRLWNFLIEYTLYSVLYLNENEAIFENTYCRLTQFRGPRWGWSHDALPLKNLWRIQHIKLNLFFSKAKFLSIFLISYSNNTFFSPNIAMLYIVLSIAVSKFFVSLSKIAYGHIRIMHK